MGVVVAHPNLAASIDIAIAMDFLINKHHSEQTSNGGVLGVEHTLDSGNRVLRVLSTNANKENKNPNSAEAKICECCCVCNVEVYFKSNSEDKNFWKRKCEALKTQLDAKKKERNCFKILHDDLKKKKKKQQVAVLIPIQKKALVAYA